MEKILLFLFLLLIPTQLGKYFWPEWSMVMGMRSDYLSPTLYLMDLVWAGLIIVKILKSKNLNYKDFFSFRNLLLVMMVGVNVVLAANRWVAIYRWLRIGQWMVTFKILNSKNLNTKVENYLKIILPTWIIVESLLGLAQVINGGSLGGIFYWIGERRFSYSTLGIAQMNLFGEGLLRAYGSFSHPNSLAGFLLVCWWWWRKQKIKRSIFYWMVLWLCLLGIFISGSRWVWLLTTGFLIFDKKQKTIKELVGNGMLGLGLIILGLGVISNNYRLSDFLSGWDSDSLNKRINLTEVAVEMIKSSPLFGIGAGNFIVSLPQYQQNNRFFWWQPVHNIFLLATAEIGLAGLGMLGLRLLKILKSLKKQENLGFLILVLLTGMVDHYWLTLPQNSWLLVVMLGVIGKNKTLNSKV